ncbi:hypothetical protein [Maribacter sp. ACAM166]|uniref:hypothetical protein n=1 Tax=Maribacter sp. ACAM166 TaxID=2508996 RepID=UPI0010FD97C2|nr:hypothetical protein [Maribacter sp. ACAM166]TLP79764.1 hypothetical protein ES765_09815 [Maribacter sp. ACAM166]
MERNRKEEIIKKAFDKAKRNSVSQAKSTLAKLIAEEISERSDYIAARTIERAYDKYVLNDTSKGEPNPDTIHLLCNYLSFENYGDFIKNQPVNALPVGDASIFINRKNIIWFVGVVIIGLSFFWYRGNDTLSESTNTSCMVWRETHYKKITCTNAADLYIEPLNLAKLTNFKKVKVNVATAFFDESTRQPMIWYYKKDTDEIDYFTAPGLHPINGKTLKVITPYIVKKYVPKHIYNENSFTE